MSINRPPAIPRRAAAPWTGRRWLIPLLGVIIVLTALIAMVAAPLVSNRVAQDKRDRVALELEPLRSELLSYELTVVQLSAESRAYALTGDPRSRDRYSQLVQPVPAVSADLSAHAADAGFLAEASEIVARGDDYIDITARIVAASDADNPDTAVALVQDDGPESLAAFLAANTQLQQRLDAEIERVTGEINDTNNTQTIVLVVAGTLGTMAAIVLVLFALNNLRLVRRLDDAQQQLEAIVSTVPGVVWEAWGKPDAANQRIDFVSSYVEDMLGYSTEEWLATPNFWLTIVHPDDHDKAARESNATFASGKPGTNEFRWVRKDGRVLNVQAFAVAIKDERGVPVGMRGVTIDVTAQRAAEAAVLAERARLQAMIASVEYGVIDVDRLGLVTYVNPAAERLLGIGDGATLGSDLHETLGARDSDGSALAAESCPLCYAVRDATTYRGQLNVRRSDGSILPVEVSATPIAPGEIATGTLIVFQDIRERLRREAMKDDFVAFASHELMNPLTSVKGFAQWLANRIEERPRSFDLESREAIETLNAEAQRMQHIVELFLDLTRIDSDRLTLNLEAADLRRVVSERVESARMRHPDVDIKYDDSSEPIQVNCDVERLHQIIANLLDNAAKYAGAPPRVSVVLEPQDDEWALLRVRDNGEGIAEADRPYIFERFYRSAGADGKKGLGVGLFVARELTHALGGTLTYTTQPGEGTEFLLRLPLTCDTPEPEARALATV